MMGLLRDSVIPQVEDVFDTEPGTGGVYKVKVKLIELLHPLQIGISMECLCKDWKSKFRKWWVKESG